MGAIPHETMGFYNYIKHKNDLHAPGVLQQLSVDCLVFELSRL